MLSRESSEEAEEGEASQAQGLEALYTQPVTSDLRRGRARGSWWGDYGAVRGGRNVSESGLGADSGADALVGGPRWCCWY